MQTQTCSERLAELWAQVREVQATPCERCGHPYGQHGTVGCIAFTSFEHLRGVCCKCNQFVDPASTLDA